jgi:hypothetical protein
MQDSRPRLFNTPPRAALLHFLLITDEPVAKIPVGLRAAQLTSCINCFNQPGTAQAKACGYILQKALISDHFSL